MQDLWLSETVFEWVNSIDGGHSTEPERVKRPYAMLAHCEQVVASTDSAFSLADAVLGLKRTIHSRLQHIEELYGLSLLLPRRVGVLERLEAVGLARPFLVKQLFELRNDIEHNDAPPPAHHRVRELIDITWYFLKTTDYACKLVPDGVQLRLGEEGSFPPEQWLSVRPSRTTPGRFNISGWVHKDFLLQEPREGFFKMSVDAMKAKPSICANPDDSIAASAYVRNSARSDDERWIIGDSALSQVLQLKVWRLALDAL